MRRLLASSEAEMVALFLRTELFSDRYGPVIRALMECDGVLEQVVTASDLSDDEVGQEPQLSGGSRRRLGGAGGPLPADGLHAALRSLLCADTPEIVKQSLDYAATHDAC